MQQICAKTHANFEVGNMIKKPGWIKCMAIVPSNGKRILGDVM